MTATLIHPTTGEQLPVILTTAEAAELLGEHRDTVIDQCRAGLLPTMPRIGQSPHRIITAKLLRQLGLLPDQIAPSPTNPPSAGTVRAPLSRSSQAVGDPASAPGPAGSTFGEGAR